MGKEQGTVATGRACRRQRPTALANTIFSSWHSHESSGLLVLLGDGGESRRAITAQATAEYPRRQEQLRHAVEPPLQRRFASQEDKGEKQKERERERGGGEREEEEREGGGGERGSRRKHMLTRGDGISPRVPEGITGRRSKCPPYSRAGQQRPQGLSRPLRC